LIAQAQATAEQEGGALAGAFLVDIENAERRYKVQLSNSVLFENKNTRVLPVATAEGWLEARISEAKAKGERYKTLTSSAPIASAEAVRFLGAPELIQNLGVASEAAHRFMGEYSPVPNPDVVLATAKLVPLDSYLMLWYLTIFVAAEAAFILMAVKEFAGFGSYFGPVAHASGR
jgi:hypothetical protein